MLELPVASALPRQKPAFGFEPFHDIADLHLEGFRFLTALAFRGLTLAFSGGPCGRPLAVLQGA
jgi:hypothetical protein